MAFSKICCSYAPRIVRSSGVAFYNKASPITSVIGTRAFSTTHKTYTSTTNQNNTPSNIIDNNTSCTLLNNNNNNNSNVTTTTTTTTTTCTANNNASNNNNNSNNLIIKRKYVSGGVPTTTGEYGYFPTDTLVSTVLNSKPKVKFGIFSVDAATKV